MNKDKQRIKELENDSNRKSKLFKILFWTAVFGIVLYGTLTIIFSSQYREQKELTYSLCELSNKQGEVIEQMYPSWAEKSCSDIRGLNLDINKTNYLCNALINNKLPDKLDCEDFIKW